MTMTHPIKLWKLSGSGNDFILLDSRDGTFDEVLDSPERAAHFARTLCHRRTGVGADGIIFAATPEATEAADLGVVFLETDGTQAGLCGNGMACFVHWAISQKIVPDGQIKVLTSAGVVLGCNLDDGYVRVCIPLPEHVQAGLDLDVAGRTLSCDFIITCVEHAVTYVDDINRADVRGLGPAIRHHEHFEQPRGVNANFVQVIDEGEIALRTYEYGVEGETLACGTGSAAAAIMAAKRFGWPADYTSGDKPVLVRARSGDVLRVYFAEADDGTINDLCLETIVRVSFSGELCSDMADLATNPPPRYAQDEPPAD